MKKVLCLILIFIMVIPTTLAVERWSDVVKTAKALKEDNPYDTVTNVDNFIRGNWTHIFYNKRRGLRDSYYERVGDCTDKANLIVYFLKQNKIRARLVYGWVGGYNDKGRFTIYKEKHDWYEYNINGTWVSDEDQYFTHLTLEGVGIW